MPVLATSKRAGRDHSVSNCSRRKQCTEHDNGRCKYYHHPLLHKGTEKKVNISSVTDSQYALLLVTSADIGGQDGFCMQAWQRTSWLGSTNQFDSFRHCRKPWIRRKECFNHDNQDRRRGRRNEDKGVQSMSNLSGKQTKFRHKGCRNSANQR